jgi:acyl-CoA synthetase (AMP-forming)/AMP-acid ligase II
MIPSIVHQLVHHPKIHEADFSSVNAMGSGAAYLPSELAEKLSNLAPKGLTFGEGNCTALLVLRSHNLINTPQTTRLWHVGMCELDLNYLPVR